MKKKFAIGCVKDILKNAVVALKDEEYQQRVWFRRQGPEVDSYLETTTHFIDRCETLFKDSNYLKYFGEEETALLKKLYDLVLQHLYLLEDKVDLDQLQEEELLNDPNWHDIQALAAEVEIKLKEWLVRNNHE